MIEEDPDFCRSVDEISNRLKVLKTKYISVKNNIRTKSGLSGEESAATKFEFFHQCHQLFYVGQDRELGVIETGIKG